MSHTPGPWTVEETHSSLEIRSSNLYGYGVASLPFSRRGAHRGGRVLWVKRAEQDANAALIAQAPALLAACEVISRDSNISAWLANNDPKALEQLRAAIAAARTDESR